MDGFVFLADDQRFGALMMNRRIRLGVFRREDFGGVEEAGRGDGFDCLDGFERLDVFDSFRGDDWFGSRRGTIAIFRERFAGEYDDVGGGL
jgi:hypothetical protein